MTPDMRAIAQADLIVTTPEKWDGVSRSWQNRSYVQKVSILIIDEIHLLGKAAGGGALAAGRRTGPSPPSSLLPLHPSLPPLLLPPSPSSPLLLPLQAEHHPESTASR